MGGEVANIAEVANKISSDIFKWFRWEKIPLMDENFPCHKVEQHKIESKRKTTSKVKKHTHPVDVVFKYFDPYLNKNVLLNTDLKCYSKSSITSTAIKIALDSLSKTIDCARGSADWQEKYVLDKSPFEVRGMLFIYNHDGEFDKDFEKYLKGIDPSSLSLKRDQILHVIDPQRIRYLNTIIADMRKLNTQKMFPRDNYSFFYPDLYLHKSTGNPDEYPATVELLSSPYMILRYGAFPVIDERTGETETVCTQGGYLIYYNQSGADEYEFAYLFDALSRFQILNSKSDIKIRVAHHAPSKNINSNYHKAIRLYVKSWGFDEYKNAALERISFDIVDQTIPNYMPGHLSWRY